MCHFGDLTGLLTTLDASGFTRLHQHCEGALASTPSDPGATRLLAVVHGYVDFARVHPGLFRLMLGFGAAVDTVERDRRRRRHRVRPVEWGATTRVVVVLRGKLAHRVEQGRLAQGGPFTWARGRFTYALAYVEKARPGRVA